MSEEENSMSINKGCKKIGAIGNVIEEKWCTVKGNNLKDISKEFDKQWKEFSNG